MIVPGWLAAPTIRRVLPWAAGALAIVAAGAWIDHRGYQRGEADCEARWEAMSLQARADMLAREAAWAAQSSAAAAALADARAATGAVTERSTHEIRTYYVDRPEAAAVECLPAERVRAARDSRAAIHAAAAG